MTGSPGLFTIAPSANFAQTLAKGLIARIADTPFSLADCLIYLPTRRAARNFGEAFAHIAGGAALLPQFQPLGDADEEELSFDAEADLELAPAMGSIRRQLLLATLIRRWDSKQRSGALSFAQASALARSLAGVMDEIETQGADLSKLDALMPPAMARHWDDVAQFLALIRDHWPAILAAEGKTNRAARRNAALAALAQRLAATPPRGMVIAAGSTGSIPATAALLKVIAHLPHGAVVLPGLDRRMEDRDWAEQKAGHPQFGFRQLLNHCGVAREAVPDWHSAAQNPARENLLRETLRPAPATDSWRALAERGGDDLAQGLDGLEMIAAADPAQEALIVALALRQALENEGCSAALVTPDRNLARRVAAELARWDIRIDDSAGQPLAHASAGAFLCLLAEAAEARFAPVPLLALLKHPFASLGEEPAAFRERARELDRCALRGPRPDPGLDGIAKAIARAMSSAMANDKTKGDGLAPLSRWWARVSDVLMPLEKVFARAEIALAELIEIHGTVAENLSGPFAGDCLLWRGADGEAAAGLIAEFAEAATDLPPIAPAFYPALLRGLAMGVPVRPRGGIVRAIAILGPLEARLQNYDLTILGGLNEGTWPAGPGPDPWFSRPMREALGLEQPERNIGRAAHDFTMLTCGPRVLLTRAVKAQGTPTIPSRWLQRLIQLTRGLGLSIPQGELAIRARQLCEVAPIQPVTRPAPTPPVAARPRRLSVTQIETWLRDPYAIYARHVLGLRKIEPLDQPIGPLERGNAIHKALELFVAEYPGPLPDDALLRLMACADRIFAAAAIPRAQLAIWRPRFLGAAQWFVNFERERRGEIARSHLEIHGTRIFDAPGGPFELRGIADRIDVLKNGGAAILDYKTGSPPSAPQIRQLLAPQLPLEAAILEAGGFPGIVTRAVDALLYLKLSGGAEPGKAQPVTDVAELTQKAIEQLTRRIAWFDEEATPYRSRVQPYSADSSGDYDHLARVREWAVAGWSDTP